MNIGIVTIRNTIADGLAKYLGIPVVLHDQVGPEQPEPFCVYSVTAAYIPISAFGDHTITDGGVKDRDAKDTRKEHVHATMSFTFCSRNRWAGKEYIMGDDEAQSLAMTARGWLSHVGYMVLAKKGIVVMDVMNAANRSTVEISEAERRYGFDARIRYAIGDERIDPAVESVRYTRPASRPREDD